MIKKAVFENDLILGMQRELQSHDKKVAMASLDQAGEKLHSAMEILEEAGLTAQADQVLSILQKIGAGSKTKPMQEIPSLNVFFESGKFTPEDLSAAMSGDTEAVAKVNLAMHEHGMSDHKIVELMGKHYMPYHLAKKILEKGHISGLQQFHHPSPKPGEEIAIAPISSPTAPAPEPSEMGDQEIVMKSLLASAAKELGIKNADFGGKNPDHSKEDASRYDEADARHKAHKPKDPRKVSDPHTKGLTPEKMVENLKHHGIVFNLADDGKADDLLEVELADDNNLEVVDEGHDPAEKTFEDES